MAVLALAFAAVPASGQDDDAWIQFQGGPDHAGTREDGPRAPFRIRWRFESPDGEDVSAAVIAGDVALTVAEDAVYAVALSTGETAWELARAGGSLSAPAVATVGPRTTVLYVETARADASASPTPVTPSPTSPTGTATPSPAGSGDQVEPSAIAVDVEDRRERWRVALGAESRSGVTVDGDTAFLGDQDGRVYAISTDDGRIVWSADVGEGVGAETEEGCQAFDGGAIDVPIAVGGDTVVAVARNPEGGAAAVTAFARASGECLWRVFPPLGSAAISPPAVVGDVVVIGSADRVVRGLDLRDGTERWSALALSLFSPLSAAAIADGAAYVADLGGGLYRLDADDGARGWSHQLNVVALTSPVVVGETVLLGVNDGRLTAFDAASGHLVWQGRTGPGRLGTIAVTHDEIVVEKAGGAPGLIAFEHDPDGRLVDVASPSELDVGRTLSRVGIAAAAVIVALAVPGVLIRRRLGDAAAPMDASVEAAPDDREASDVDEEPNGGSGGGAS